MLKQIAVRENKEHEGKYERTRLPLGPPILGRPKCLDSTSEEQFALESLLDDILRAKKIPETPSPRELDHPVRG